MRAVPPRRRSTAVPATAYPVERTKLANGLRVVLAPDKASPVVGVAVYYDVGFRSEPEGRTGFAHLFEHLMFQGSANLGKMEHAHRVQGAGGTLNGSTRPDYTNYYQAMPSNALELALFLEADRMRSVRLTQENLDNQIAVVKEEINVNVNNQPYGGFPWIHLPPVMFETFPNAHNGYGDFAELESATLQDAESFFDRYYAPGNAVLTVAGDFAVAEALELVERHFGDIPKRPVPRRPSFDEPAPTEERRAIREDALAPTPAVATAWRVPDPIAELDDYLGFVVLTELLTEGDASRLQRRLLHEEQIVTHLSGYLGTFGDPFDVRDPTMLQLEAYLPEDVEVDRVLGIVDEELDRVAADGVPDQELARVQARIAAQLLRRTDQVLARTLTMTVLEQQRGRAELINELPALLAAIPATQVQEAAARLAGQTRAVLELRPGGAR